VEQLLGRQQATEQPRPAAPTCYTLPKGGTKMSLAGAGLLAQAACTTAGFARETCRTWCACTVHIIGNIEAAAWRM
jgi:hypothetical protein